MSSLLKISRESQPLEKNAAIIFAMMDFPKRLGLVTQTNFSVVPILGMSVSRIADLSTK